MTCNNCSPGGVRTWLEFASLPHFRKRSIRKCDFLFIAMKNTSVVRQKNLKVLFRGCLEIQATASSRSSTAYSSSSSPQLQSATPLPLTSIKISNHTPIKVQCCFVTSPISCLRPCRTGWSINCRDRISSSSLNY